jgi:hypothetical protein
LSVYIFSPSQPFFQYSISLSSRTFSQLPFVFKHF